MKMLVKRSLLVMGTVILFASCGDITKKVEDRLNDLNAKAGQLDSLINKEVDKVMALDTLINFESEKVKQLDSLINTSSTRIDSIANKKIELLKNIIN